MLNILNSIYTLSIKKHFSDIFLYTENEPDTQPRITLFLVESYEHLLLVPLLRELKIFTDKELIYCFVDKKKHHLTNSSYNHFSSSNYQLLLNLFILQEQQERKFYDENNYKDIEDIFIDSFSQKSIIIICIYDAIHPKVYELCNVLIQTYGSIYFKICRAVTDILTDSKPKLHIASCPPIFVHNKNILQVSSSAWNHLQENTIVVTPAHLLSYSLFSQEMEMGLSRQLLFYKMNRLANGIYREKIANISIESLQYSYDELFAECIHELKKNEYLVYKDKKYISTDKLKSLKNHLVKNNTVFHGVWLDYYLQLIPIKNKIDPIWEQTEEYD